MSSARKILPNYTYEDYVLWKGQWELIDGMPYAMSPMATPIHQGIASELNVLLANELKENDKCNCRVFHPLDLKISESTVVNPDLLIVCKPIEKKFLDFAPELVVEIHSPSTILKDKITKYDLYEAYGIKYYIMVNPMDKTITKHELVDGKYEEKLDPTFEIDSNCSISPDLAKIWS